MGFLKTKDLTFEYIRRNEIGDVESVNRAIDNLDIVVNKGEFIGILGHNGSGKSTLAKHMNVLLMPTTGSVWVNGNDTSELDKLWDIRESVGMVFQNPDNQIIGSVVEEDVGFGPENLGIPTSEIWQRVTRALKKVGMLNYRYHSPNKLSGGQKQRVAIAGVFAMKPECIILDEPTAMLDPCGRREVMDTILELNHTEKITIILVTHYMDEVVNADRIFVMDKGKIEMSGTPKEIFSRVDELKKLRLSVPQVTELAHRLKLKGMRIGNGILTVEELLCELENYRSK